MTFLLDTNVLVALIDPTHIQHDAAHNWFAAIGHTSWATCPITENGVLSIVGHMSYANSPGTPAAVAPLLSGLRALPGHVFWTGNVSLLDADRFDAGRLLTSAQVTDTYLLGLAQAHGGQLATFDRRLVTDAIRDGAKHLHIIR
jgi:uncharacterized protein